MPRWEYMWMQGSDARPLNREEMDRLGDTGWELVAVVHSTNTESFLHFGKQIGYFKRQRTKETE